MLSPEKASMRIEAGLLDAINEAAVQTYPNEFVAALRAEKGVIRELLMLPGTVSGENSGIIQLHMLPIDFSVVGTVHSHPGHSARPSEADLAFFQQVWFHRLGTPESAGEPDRRDGEKLVAPESFTRKVELLRKIKRLVESLLEIEIHGCGPPRGGPRSIGNGSPTVNQ